MFSVLKLIVKYFISFLSNDVMRTLFYEFAAFKGNIFTRPLELNSFKPNYINLGSGSIVVNDFINIDFFTTPGIDYGADLRRPLKIADNMIDGIFCEHTIEHLKYDEVSCLLMECNRIMKVGAVIRIVLPDISLFIKPYYEKNNEWFDRWEQLMFIDSPDLERAKRRLATPMQSISFVTQEYGHVSAWDVPTIKFYLEQSGFHNVTETRFNQGQCSKLLIELDEEDRKFVSLYVEAVK